MPSKPNGKPFTSQTGRAASLKSPWRKQQFCATKRARAYRDLLDQRNKSSGTTSASEIKVSVDGEDAAVD